MLIMLSNKLKSNLNKALLILVLIIFTGCGSFNSSSLVSADGIYGNGNNSETENSNSKYYENYFKEKALELDNDFVFSDSINSNSDFINSNQISYSANKAAWGQIPDTKDYIIDYYSYGSRYFGYGYYGQMYSPYGYGYGYGYPYYSYFAMRNWYRYGWGIGYYPFYLDFYPYGWWGRTMPFGYRNRYSSYGAYGNNIYDNYINRDYNNNISYNDGRRGSSSNVVIYGNGKNTSTNGNSKNSNTAAKQITYYNVGRSVSLQDDNNIGNNDTRIRTYKEFVKNNNTNSVSRNRSYSRPDMGVGLSGSTSSTSNQSNRNEVRRYYNNPNNLNNAKGSKPVQYDWGLGGRNRSNYNGSQTRSYSNPSSSNSSSSSTRSYSSPSSTSGSYSRPPSSNASSSSSSGSSSSVGSGGRGSR